MDGWNGGRRSRGRRGRGRSGRYGRRSMWSRVPAILFVLVLLGAGGTIAYVILHDPSPSPPDVEATDDPTSEPDAGARQVLGRTYVAWVPGGFEDDAAAQIPSLEGLDHGVPVLSGVAWLSRATEDGEPVRPPYRGMAYPIEVAAATPAQFKPFLPASMREAIPGLAGGGGALSETGARLRGVGVGAELGFPGVTVEVVAILPDVLMGGHELLVSRRTGEDLGLSRDRYALVDPAEDVTPQEVRSEILGIVPDGTYVEVRAWSPEVPYLRHGDGMSSMAKLKLNFGEFAADPEGGELQPDPVWVEDNIVTQAVPLLGEITCHEKVVAMVAEAMAALEAEGADGSVLGSGYAGCYVPRFIGHDPTRSLSYHSWGAAIDINAEANPFGAEPDQPGELVEAMEAVGFAWGGRWEVPDGMHFEWLRFVAA